MLARRRVLVAGVAAAAVVAGATAVWAFGGDETPSVEAGTTTSASTTLRDDARWRRPTSTTTSSTTSTPAEVAPTSAPPDDVSAAANTPAQAQTPITAPQPLSPPPTTPTTAPPRSPFRSSISTVTTASLGASWTAGLGCTPASQLRLVQVTHWGYDDRAHQGRIVVAASQAEKVVAIFRDLYVARFPINSMVPMSEFGGSDAASMRVNNTSGYNCRTVAGTSTLSEHAKGLAIDVNPLVNPWVKGTSVDPPEGRQYADRSLRAKGMIHADDAVVRAFARQGWQWGGYWTSAKDYQHFSPSGR